MPFLRNIKRYAIIYSLLRNAIFNAIDSKLVSYVCKFECISWSK